MKPILNYNWLFRRSLVVTYHLQGYQQSCKAKVDEQCDGGHPHLETSACPADPTCQQQILVAFEYFALHQPAPRVHGVMVVNLEMMNWLASGNDKSFRIGKQNWRPTKARE